MRTELTILLAVAGSLALAQDPGFQSLKAPTGWQLIGTGTELQLKPAKDDEGLGVEITFKSTPSGNGFDSAFNNLIASMGQRANLGPSIQWRLSDGQSLAATVAEQPDGGMSLLAMMPGPRGMETMSFRAATPQGFEKVLPIASGLASQWVRKNNRQSWTSPDGKNTSSATVGGTGGRTNTDVNGYADDNGASSSSTSTSSSSSNSSHNSSQSSSDSMRDGRSQSDQNSMYDPGHGGKSSSGSSKSGHSEGGNSSSDSGKSSSNGSTNSSSQGGGRSGGHLLAYDSNSRQFLLAQTAKGSSIPTGAFRLQSNDFSLPLGLSSAKPIQVWIAGSGELVITDGAQTLRGKLLDGATGCQALLTVKGKKLSLPMGIVARDGQPSRTVLGGLLLSPIK